MASTLDSRLTWKLDDYLRRRREQPADVVEHEGDALLNVNLTFRDHVGPLIEAGFQPRDVEGDLASGSVRLRDLQRLSQLPQVVYMESAERLSARLKDSVPFIGGTAVRTGSAAYTGAGVIVGVVDSGVDVTHHSLRDSAGNTRIKALWDQTLLDGGAAPAPFTKGVEFTAAAINAIINPSPAPPTPVPFPSQDSGHGTHVTSTAAGDGSQAGNCDPAGTYVGVAPDAEIVVVKTTFDNQDIVDAVKYIFSKAVGDQAAVVNLSLGTDSGSHDGKAWLDRRLSALVGAKGRVIVAASGNAGEAQHAFKTIAPSGSTSISFRIGSGCRHSDTFHIWYAGASRLSLAVASPSGATSPAVAPPAAIGDPEVVSKPVIDGHTIHVTSKLDNAINHMHEISFRLAPPLGGAVANGKWIITLTETAGTEAKPHCWINWAGRVFEERDIAAGATGEFAFYIEQDWKFTDECEITYTGDARYSIEIITPGGDSVTANTSVTMPATKLAAPGHVITVMSKVNPGSEHKITFRIARDTAGTSTKKNVATGKWRFKLTDTASKPGKPACRMPGDRYLNACPQLVVADRDPSCSVGTPAAGDNIIAVGNFDYRDGKLDKMSGRGPRLDHVGALAPGLSDPRKPDVVAPGVGIFAAKSGARTSPLCCECCTDFYYSDSGTSMAAPHVTGVVALMLQKNRELTFDEVRSKLRESAQHTPGPAAYSEPWGWGKVDAVAAMGLVLPLAPPVAPPMILVPLAATAWRLYEPVMERLRDLQATMGAFPAGRLLVALTSKHYDEVARLVRTVRRVAAAWRLMAGPVLLQTVMSWRDPDVPVFPVTLQGRPLGEGLERLLRELTRVGTLELQQDIRAYRPLVRALPGASLTDLSFFASGSRGGTAGYARAHSP